MSETIDFTPLTATDHEPIARLLHRALVHWYESRLGQGSRFGDSHEPFMLFPDVYESLDPSECVTARTDSGELIAPSVKAGDKILFGKWSGTEVKLDGEDLLIMKESDILGIIS